MNPGKWKYEMLTLKPAWSSTRLRERLKQALDEMGNKGWELVTAPPLVSAPTETVLIFKRPA